MECPLFDHIFMHIENLKEQNQESNYITPCRMEFLSTQFPKKFDRNFSFSEEDLQCLDEGEWINDEVLNSYIKYMAIQANNPNVGFTNSFFYKKLERDGAQAASCWQGVKERPINTYQKFLVPICCGAHWILACFDFINQKLVFCDSLNIHYGHIGKVLNTYLIYMGIPAFELFYESVPQQHNADDCGVFVMEFVRCYLFGYNLHSFSQRDIPHARRRIKEELYLLLSE